ncbi:MAG: DNA-binding protein [Haloarculaceae archaeon]
MTDPTPPTRVPADETPAGTCPYCERPFRSERARDLHVGELHGEAATAGELDRYETALDRERDELWVFHARAVVALGVTYAATVVLYMVALGSGLL